MNDEIRKLCQRLCSFVTENLTTTVLVGQSVVQIGRGNRDNLGIIFLIAA